MCRGGSTKGAFTTLCGASQEDLGIPGVALVGEQATKFVLAREDVGVVGPEGAFAGFEHAVEERGGLGQAAYLAESAGQLAEQIEGLQGAQGRVDSLSVMTSRKARSSGDIVSTGPPLMRARHFSASCLICPTRSM